MDSVAYSPDTFYWHDLTLIPVCISNNLHGKVWDEIAYPFINFNGATVALYERMYKVITPQTLL